MSQDLCEAKQSLIDKLGPNYGTYIQLLGKWFRGSITKEEFDKNAKQLIDQNFVLEHNKFWLAFFHHCANNASSSLQSRNFQLNNASGKNHNYSGLEQDHCGSQPYNGPSSASVLCPASNFPCGDNKVRCLPNKVITHMKIYVIAWEMGLDSVNDNVSVYINLALQHFLKNIITELICTKTAYRLRENRFKYAIGVKPMNPYLNNSLKIYSSNLEYDPYQIESGKMNSSLVDTYAYNDSLFPSRLYEAQALYEYACSTTSITRSQVRKTKRLKLSEIFLDQDADPLDNNTIVDNETDRRRKTYDDIQSNDTLDNSKVGMLEGERTSTCNIPSERRLTLFHLLIAFLSDRTIIPSQSLYSINLERIFTKLSN